MDTNQCIVPEYKCENFSDISECFKSLHRSFSQELKNVKEDVCVLKEKVDVLDSAATWVNSEITDLHSKHLPSLRDKLEEEKNDRLALDLWGRKWNLVVRGIPGTSKELPKDTLVKFREFLVDELKLDKSYVNSILVQAIHRLQSGDDDKKNIIVRFVSLIDRDTVLNQAISVLRPGCGKAVITDLPPSLSKLRGELLHKRSKMHESERKRTRLVFRKEAPFLKLVTRDS